MTTRAAHVILLLIALSVGGCDQATKRWAETSLDGKPPVVLAQGRLDLTYAENPGVAFGNERVLPAPLRAPVVWGAALLALAMLGVGWWRHRGAPTLTTVAAAVIAGGVAGNLLDRVIRGNVIRNANTDDHWRRNESTWQGAIAVTVSLL